MDYGAVMFMFSMISSLSLLQIKAEDEEVLLMTCGEEHLEIGE